MTSTRPTRTFLVVAGAAGAVYGNYAVVLPIFGTAIGVSVSIIGLLLAIGTLTVAIGSISAGLIVRWTSASILLPVGMGTAALGDAFLIQGSLLALGLGSVLIGSGLGLYWAGSQAALSSGAGREDSERGFISQFVVYTLGTVAGSVISGAVVNSLHTAGLSPAAAGRGGFVLALGVAIAAVGLERSRRPAPSRASRVAGLARGAGVDALLQLSDLCLVSALAFVLALAPVILRTHFGFNSLQVGAGYGAASLAKMAGSFFAGRWVRLGGRRLTIALMVGAGALLSLLLAAISIPLLFVVVLVFASMTAGGVWPVVVDATLGSVRPERRAAMALTWSAREYPVIALSTVVGGWMLEKFDSPSTLYLLTAGLLACALITSRLLHGPDPLREASAETAWHAAIEKPLADRPPSESV